MPQLTVGHVGLTAAVQSCRSHGSALQDIMRCSGCILVCWVKKRHSVKGMLLCVTRCCSACCSVQVTMFWLKRVRDLSPVLRDLLGVQNVWCDTRTEQNSQNFVLWAGYILEQR